MPTPNNHDSLWDFYISSPPPNLPARTSKHLDKKAIKQRSKDVKHLEQSLNIPTKKKFPRPRIHVSRIYACRVPTENLGAEKHGDEVGVKKEEEEEQRDEVEGEEDEEDEEEYVDIKKLGYLWTCRCM